MAGEKFEQPPRALSDTPKGPSLLRRPVTGIQDALALSVWVENALGGGGGGGGISDTFLTDDSGTYFFLRDDGTTITHVTLSGDAYTPGTNIRPAESISLGLVIAAINSLSTSNHADLGALHADLLSLLTNIVLGAGSHIIGQVGVDQTNPGTTNRVVAGGSSVVTPADQPQVTAASAYATGNLCGGKLTFQIFPTGKQSGLIQAATLNMPGVQTATFDLVLFNGDPAATTFTDKANLSIAAADVSKVIGVLHLNDVTSFTSGTVTQALGSSLPIDVATIYGALVVRGTPTFASTADLVLKLRTIQD